MKTNKNSNTIITVEDCHNVENSYCDIKYHNIRFDYTLLFDWDEQSNELHCLGLDADCYPRKVVIPSEIAGCPVTKLSVSKDGFGAFCQNHSIEEIIIPESVIDIEDYAFEDCESLETVAIPKSVTKIGNNAFSGCKNLKEIIIPKSVNSIGFGVLSDCPQLSQIKVEKGNKTYDSRNGCNAIIQTFDNKMIASCKTTKIPASVTEIEYTYYKRNDITEVSVPDNIKAIGQSSFSDCYGLTKAVIPDTVNVIGENAFSDCRSMTDVVIPDSVTVIGDYAFSGCSRLSSVIIPNSVAVIGEFAFWYCQSLEKVFIPDSVVEIGHAAFHACENLKEIIINNPSLLHDASVPKNVVIKRPME